MDNIPGSDPGDAQADNLPEDAIFAPRPGAVILPASIGNENENKI